VPEIGFIQGRLSPPVNHKIQAFPWAHWREEFATAQRCGFRLMEWTLDHDRLPENPLITPAGRREIRQLSAEHGVRVGSLTGDCFMQAPFYKASGAPRQALLAELQRVVEACLEIGIRYIVVPLVDNGRIEDRRQHDDLRVGLSTVEASLRDGGARIVFESDFDPPALARFISEFPAHTFGINYDIGNSAALGFKSEEEFDAYGDRIDNVHVKDRKLKGTTVPLGTGNADLPYTLRLLRERGYRGHYILQTARAADGNHAVVLCRYRDMVRQWLAA
jgi:L-ribulose-5-phosphate 3-epimerase